MLLRLFPMLWLAFKTWMLVDAYRKRQPQFWYFVIFFVPFGEVVYFIMVKSHDFRGQRLFSIFPRPPSIDELRSRHRTTMSLENQLTLAKALADAGQREESASEFEKVLARWPDEPEALFGLGTVRAAGGDHPAAETLLTRLLEVRPGHRDWAGWRELAQSQRDGGRREESLETLRRLVQHSPRLDHELLLAECLSETGREEEARRLLERMLEEARHTPAYARRHNRAAASRARRLLLRLR